jgi:membrane fusion protein, heavy metal efflux system
MNKMLLNFFGLVFCSQLCCSLVLAADTIKMSTLQQKNLGIQTSALQVSTGNSSQAYPAEVVVPIDQVRVVSTAHAGLMNQLTVTSGQTVKRGQLLAQITSPELVTLQREYLQSQSQYRLAKQSLDRDTALFKDGIIAEKRLQASQSSYRESQVSLNEQHQLLTLSGVPDSAIQNLQSKGGVQNDIALTAPISGVVLEVMVSQGQRVDSTMPLFKIAQLNPLWVEARVPLVAIKKSNIQKGTLIHIKDIDVSGKVIGMLPSMRSQDQTAIVRAVINQGADNLFPSQMVDVMITHASNVNDSNFDVPTAAVVNHQARHIVFVQTTAGFEPREITIINTQGNISTVSGALTGKEKIATSGTATIKASWLGMGVE